MVGWLVLYVAYLVRDYGSHQNLPGILIDGIFPLIYDDHQEGSARFFVYIYIYLSVINAIFFKDDDPQWLGVVFRNGLTPR